MPRKPAPPLERDVQADVLKWLNAQPHIWAWRRNVGAMAVPAKGGAPRWMRFGQKGMADISGVVLISFAAGPLGLRLEVEVKRDDGSKPDADQRAWLAAVASYGGIATWCNSVAMLERKLRGGFARRGWKWGDVSAVRDGRRPERRGPGPDERK